MKEITAGDYFTIKPERQLPEEVPLEDPPLNRLFYCVGNLGSTINFVIRGHLNHDPTQGSKTFLISSSNCEKFDHKTPRKVRVEVDIDNINKNNSPYSLLYQVVEKNIEILLQFPMDEDGLPKVTWKATEGGVEGGGLYLPSEYIIIPKAEPKPYISYNGFYTNPKNWDRGLSLV